MKLRLTIFMLAACALAPATSMSAPKQKSPPPAPAAPPAAQPETPPAPQPEAAVDLAFGAYQRGDYLLAFNEARRRAETEQDTKAMTLLGELYAGGFGTPRDDDKAFEWYRKAAGRGDRAAMAALGLFYLKGRAPATNRLEAG